MHRHSLPIGIFAIACGLLAHAAPAWAAAETWVSGTGTDTGACPVTAPCRTFAYAQTKTNNGGTLSVLSSGNFGPVSINKSISIVAQGAEALINTAVGGAAIRIQAAADRIVSLRGLTIDLQGTANIGISFVSGAALHVQNCVIRRSNEGIRFAPASGTSELTVADSMVANNGFGGIIVAPSGSASARVVLDRVRVEKTGSGGPGIFFQGLSTSGSITATVRDSVVAGSGSQGIEANGGGGGETGFGSVMIDRSASVNNGGAGILSSFATIRIGDSTVSGNSTGLATVKNGVVGVIASYGTNKVNGNNVDGVPNGTNTMK